MNSISISDFLNIINDLANKKEKRMFYITDDNFGKFYVESIDESKIEPDIFQILFDKNVNHQAVYQTISNFFAGRSDEITSHNFMGEYGAILYIDELIIIDFKYTSQEGQNWLYKHKHNVLKKAHQ